MAIAKTEMKTRKILVEIPSRANARDVRLMVKKFFSFEVRRFYGKDKTFPMVRIKWKATA